MASGSDEESFNHFADNLPTICWVANPDGYITWYNRAWHEYCGTSPAEMEGWGWTSVHDPEVLPAVSEKWGQSIETGLPFEMVFPLRGADGVYRNFLTRVRPKKSVEGAVLRWYGVNIDIQDELDRSVQSRRDADFLNKLLESSGDCIKVVDMDGAMRFMSAGGMAVMEVEDFSTLDGRPWIELWRGDHENEARAALEDAKAGRKGHFQGLARTLAGTPKWWDVQVSPIMGADGKPERLLSISRDVTSTHIAEQKLRDLNANLAEQVQVRTADRDRIWRLSTDLMLAASLEGVINAVNPAWTTSLGWEEDHLLGHSLLDFIHPDDIASTVAEIGKLETGGATSKFENRFRRTDGGYRIFSWIAVPADNLINAVGRDITIERDAQIAHQHTQELLIQAQKMEAVGQLTGGLAHDFNNLLAGISGSLEFIRTRLAQGRLSDVDRYVTVAQSAAQRAAALTHRLLAFSRRQTLDPKPTDINRLVEGMNDLIRRSIGPAIELEVVGAAGAWTVLVDPPQLENALLNLCINARDAMPDGGRITIETANKWIDRRIAAERELDPGQYVSLCVTDTGTGMSAETIAQVFDPFFTTKPTGEGTGLGLSMIHGFAKQSGGQVRVYSEVGLGTTMCIYLPRHLGDPVKEIVEPAASVNPKSTKDEVVLVVDDEPSIRLLITEVLSELGYAVIEAADSVMGLKVLRSSARIDLMVTDVGLPGGMNGRQLADAGRFVRPDLKVLFITGYAENAAVGHGHLPHGMHVLAKPFPMDTLASRISELIDSMSS